MVTEKEKMAELEHTTDNEDDGRTKIRYLAFLVAAGLQRPLRIPHQRDRHHLEHRDELILGAVQLGGCLVGQTVGPAKADGRVQRLGLGQAQQDGDVRFYHGLQRRT